MKLNGICSFAKTFWNFPHQIVSTISTNLQHVDATVCVLSLPIFQGASHETMDYPCSLRFSAGCLRYNSFRNGFVVIIWHRLWYDSFHELKLGFVHEWSWWRQHFRIPNAIEQSEH